MSASAVRMGRAFVEIGADPKKLFAALGKVTRSIGNVGAQMTRLGTRMTAIGAAVAAPAALAVRQFANFDDAIRMVAAVSGAAGNDLQKLNDRALELGASTSFTAVQVAGLMTELGRAGFKPDQIVAMTGAVLDLARATGTDSTLASGILAATLRQFSLEAGDAARAADVLTKAANSTNVTVEGLGESLKFAGPVASSLGMSLEDTVAILGTLGNVGIQGSEAGTAIRRLAVISAGAGEQLQKLFGVSNVDGAGNLKPLVDILDEINTATAQMGAAERTEKMAAAFGLLGITSANVLSQTAGGVRGLADELRGAEGTASVAAKAMDAGLGGAMRIATSALEGASIALGQALAPALTTVITRITQMAGGVKTFFNENQKLVESVGAGVVQFAAVGAALVTAGLALQGLSLAAGGILGPLGLVLGTVFSLGLSFLALTAKVAAFSVTSIAAAVASGAAWITASLPIIGLIAAAASLGAALFVVFDGMGSIRSAIGGVVGGLQSMASEFSAVKDVGVSAIGEIMDSISAGDMGGAMQVAMQGLKAAFTIGANAFLNAVAAWGVNLVNTFDFYISSIPFLRFLGKDKYEFSLSGSSTSSTPDQRADQRFAELRDAQERRRRESAAVADQFNQMITGRQTARARSASAGAGSPTAPIAQADTFLADIDAMRAGPDPVGDLMRGFEARRQRQAELMAAQQRMQSEAASQAEVAGTFSASAIGGMGFGSSLQQQMADYAKRTAEATEAIADEGALAATE